MCPGGHSHPLENYGYGPETLPFKVEERKKLRKTHPRGGPETEEVLQKSGEERALERKKLGSRKGEGAGGRAGWDLPPGCVPSAGPTGPGCSAVPMTLSPLPWFRDAQPLWVGLGAPHRDQAGPMKKQSLSMEEAAGRALSLADPGQQTHHHAPWQSYERVTGWGTPSGCLPILCGPVTPF